MVKRSKCLYNGNIIGIESIFTAINGKQINIPDKVERLRELGRKGLLFCPCGCGSNLILIAGDKNLREQHFRIKNSDETDFNCKITYEGEESLNTKIALKCWLEDKLSKSNLQCEVPVNVVSDTGRKYEYTVFEPETGIGIGYWRYRANISDEKVSILNKCASRVIYIVGDMNAGVDGQYPEFMMKIQKTQCFNLYISIGEKDSVYESSILTASVFEKNIDGEWVELNVCSGSIIDFNIDLNGTLFYRDTPIITMAENKLSEFHVEQNHLKEKRQQEAEEQKRRIEEEKRERERRQIEFQKRQEQLRIEAEKRQEQLRINEEKRKEEQKLRAEKKEQDWIDFKNNIDALLNQQTEQVVDPDGTRWFKCKFCGKKGTEKDFWSHGGQDGMNLAICYGSECIEKNEKIREERNKRISEERQKKKDNLVKLICPECGNKLVVKNGRYGEFYGCSDFPRCRYTQNKR